MYRKLSLLIRWPFVYKKTSNYEINMTTPELNNESFDDDFDLRKFIGIIWGGKALILSVSFIFSFVAVMSSMQLEDYYSSEALLVPSSEESNSSGMAGVSGLASLAGIGIGAGSTSKTKEAIAVLKSRKFIVDFIQKYNLMIPILAAKSWDSVNNELKIDPSIFDIESSKFNPYLSSRLLGTQRWLRKLLQNGN